MKEKFHLGKSVYIIIALTLILGLFLEFVRADFIMTYQQYQDQSELGEFEPADMSVLNEMEQLSPEQYLLVRDLDDPSSNELTDNLMASLHYVKKNLTVTSVEEIPENVKSFRTIILTFEDLTKIKDLALLENYVSNGGHLFMAVRPAMSDALYQLYRKLGMYEFGDFITTSGFSLNSNLLINHEGLSVSDDFILNSSLSVGLDPKAEVLATSSEGVPLLWKTSYGEGSFMVFNGTTLHSKVNRGLFIGSISELNEDFIYPVMNMKLFYLDAFPGPILAGVDEHIFKEYQMNREEFIRNIWWPFFQKEGAKFGYSYTSSFVLSYEDSFPVRETLLSESKEQLIKYGREIVKNGGEIGFYGFNHHPLEWRTSSRMRMEDVKAGLEMSKELVEAAFPTYKLNTYVPPNENVSKEGLKMLQEVIPSVQIISSTYLGDSSGDNQIGQEFSWDEKGATLPRITEGYEYSDEVKWTIANAMTLFGAFSHAVYPLDVFQSEKNWDEMTKSLHEMNKEMIQKFPWLRGMTASEAAQRVRMIEQTDFRFHHKEDGITVYLSAHGDGMYFILRTDKKIKQVENANLQRIDKETYLVEAKGHMIEIEWDDDQ
ncbi:DUF2194 domain-containing protein [Bacillus timonensis]|nr:DUF2194 domain-containing protein [Bacillus timonensis]